MTFRLGETNIDTGANFDIIKKHSYVSQNSSNFFSHLSSVVIICCFDYRLAPRPLVESNWGRSRFLRQLCLQAKNYQLRVDTCCITALQLVHVSAPFDAGIGVNPTIPHPNPTSTLQLQLNPCQR